jgi:hypothetical protein
VPGIELHCCGASGPKINYFFNVEIIFGVDGGAARAAGEASDFRAGDFLLGRRTVRYSVRAVIALPSRCSGQKNQNFRPSLQAIPKSKRAVVASCARALRWRHRNVGCDLYRA